MTRLAPGGETHRESAMDFATLGTIATLPLEKT